MRQWLLNMEPNRWSKLPDKGRYDHTAASSALHTGTQPFTLVRHPLPRFLSGLRMFAEYRNFKPDMEWTMYHLLQPVTMLKSIHTIAQSDVRHSGTLVDWYWHMMSQTNHNAHLCTWFRWEDTEPFVDWISKWIPAARSTKIPVDNASDKNILIECPRKCVDQLNQYLKTDCDTFGYTMQDPESMIRIV